ncbi:AMP-dependent synthetase/ligase [Cordyceps javanica]|uniref:AMP-dependent synthetase/ligase n=1 Tax=Cordyceps javanica TaxID=43265 RepID=A0A545VLM3_9HYPO|nr:AMP-dependent synthetase/ligase [Cordyceps javanica]TQW02621.1 AMP-dependent synthetase/ligase [Cordyceps javanica]
MSVPNTKPSFPQDPLLVKLIRAAQAVPEHRIIIHDMYGLQKTYPELLGDILRTRSQLQAVLPATCFNENGLLSDASLYQTACTKTGYEFAVAFFAVRALGGAFVPLDAAAALERQADTLTKANSTCILTDQGSIAEVETVADHVLQTSRRSLSVVPISFNQAGVSPDDISIAEGTELNPDGPGFVVFTSGTTGYSKGVVLRRYCFAAAPIEQGDGAVVNYNASHWLGGTKNIIDGLLTCKTVFALNTPASSADVLDTFKNHHITHFVFNPALLRGMKQLLLGESEQQLTEERRYEISKHFSGITFFLSIGGLVDRDTVDFWTEVLGCPFQNRYGTTELGGLPTLGISNKKGSVGKIAPGVEVKLSEGTHGRLFIKSPDRFLCYLGDEEKTKAAFDDDGFYRTGDIAELVDDELIFHGRERDDYVIRGGCTISTVEVERALMALGYFEEATVVAVPVSESVQLCGAVVRPKQSHTAEMSIGRVRQDLWGKLDEGKWPVAMRILGLGEELPMTATGKPVKRQVIEDFFYDGDCGRDWFTPETPPPSVQCQGIIATA